MKKFIVPIILAAVLGIGGGITAVSLNRSTSAEDTEMTELKTGTYYLNGDKNSNLWLEVNEDFLILKGKDIDNSLKSAIATKFHGLAPDATPDDTTATIMQNEFNECKTLYCTEKIYIVEPFLPEQSKSLICVSRFNTESTPEELRNSNAAFTYNYAERSINLALFGDFFLVE